MCRALRLTLKLSLFILALLLPTLAFGRATSRIRLTIYQKLNVAANQGNYKDSLLNAGIQDGTLEIASITNCMTKTDTLIFPVNTFRRVVGRDSGLKIISVFKRKTYGAVSNLVGFTEATENIWGNVSSGTQQFTQDHSGDSLILWIQPTPSSQESLWVKYACYGKRYDTLRVAGADSVQALDPENPLPAAFEKLIPPLVAARLLVICESPYRNDVAEFLYREYLQAAQFLPENLVKRLVELWPLPSHIRSSPDVAEPK